MRAVALDYSRRKLAEREAVRPRINHDSEVLFRIHEVGVCGTDRELAGFAIGQPPAGEDFLILGHEAVGQVVRTGAKVKTSQPGDWVVPMIRRPCDPPCPSCARGRRDLCVSGQHTERGIFGLHGYFCEHAVDEASDLVAVPQSLAARAVLIEPLSVVEKAVETAFRLHEADPRTALVLGAGPIGILGALVLQLRNLEVAVHSIEPASHPRARLLAEAGIEYLPQVRDRAADIVIEATGSPEATLDGVRRLAPLGVYVVLGASDARGEMPFERMVIDNLTVVGSVNASPGAFARAVADLGRLPRPLVDKLIRRVSFADFEQSILGPPTDAVKLVHVIGE